MVYAIVRHTVADYDHWRTGFDQNEVDRRAAGATGVQQVYRDLEDPNVITIILEWDNAENAGAFMSSPELREAMQAAGVIGMPAVRTLTSRS